jgi:hypothetical protein
LANEKNKNFAAVKKILPELKFSLVSHLRDLAGILFGVFVRGFSQIVSAVF